MLSVHAPVSVAVNRVGAVKCIGALMLAAIFSIPQACDKPVVAEQVGTIPVMEVTAVEKRSFVHHLQLNSTARAQHEALLTPKVSARVEKLLKDRGDRVRKGEELAQLDQTDYAIALDVAEGQHAVALAAQEQAQAVLAAAEKNFSRIKDLYEKKALSQSDFEQVETGYIQAKAGVSVAQAQVRQAEAGLRNAQRQLRETVIRAPFDGYVVNRMLDVGEMAAPQTPLFQMVNHDTVKLDVAVTELEFASISTGMNADVMFDALPGSTFTAKVERINEQVDVGARSVLVRLVMENKDGVIKPGMTARVSLSFNARDYLVLPRNAVLTPDNESGKVYVVRDDKTVEEHTVSLGGVEGSFVIITGGVEAGTRVTIGGGTRLVTGATIRIAGEK